MKAAVVEPGGVLRVRRVPIPPYFPYQTLVRLTYGATCAGTDQGLLEGRHAESLVLVAPSGTGSARAAFPTSGEGLAR